VGLRWSIITSHCTDLSQSPTTLTTLVLAVHSTAQSEGTGRIRIRKRLPVILIGPLSLAHLRRLIGIELLEPGVGAVVGTVEGHDEWLLQSDLVLKDRDVARWRGQREREAGKVLGESERKMWQGPLPSWLAEMPIRIQAINRFRGLKRVWKSINDLTRMIEPPSTGVKEVISLRQPMI
jgi:hypothetical protein